MPLYQYKCKQCGNQFERLIPIHLRDNSQWAYCRKCGGDSKRLISTFNWSFGWVLSDRSLNEKWGPRDEFVRNI